MKVKLTTREIQTLLGSQAPDFPKYATQIINLANQNAQGTRPKTVGQMTELIREFPDDSLLDWETWYQERHPNALADATIRIYSMVEQLRAAIAQIDEAMVRRWVEDLVLVKTFIGLRFQEAILRKVAEQKGLDYRASTSDEESAGIDGYIGEMPVSIKPDTYRAQALLLPENIGVGMIYYTKLKDGIALEFDF